MDESVKVQADGDGDDDDDDGLESFLFIIFMTRSTQTLRCAFPLSSTGRDCSTHRLYDCVLFWLENPRRW